MGYLFMRPVGSPGEVAAKFKDEYKAEVKKNE